MNNDEVRKTVMGELNHYSSDFKKYVDELLLKGITHDQVTWERDVALNQLKQLDHDFGENSKLRQALPEMVEEHNKCFQYIQMFELKNATPSEMFVFELVGQVMQTLGALIDTIKESEKNG